MTYQSYHIPEDTFPLGLSSPCVNKSHLLSLLFPLATPLEMLGQACIQWAIVYAQSDIYCLLDCSQFILGAFSVVT